MSSISSSQPVIPALDQQLAAFLQSLSSVAEGIGQSVYQWGQGVFNQVGTVTNETIGQYLDTANQSGGLASNILSQYENVAAPEYNALVNEANTYASTPFIQEQQGQAEATAEQAGNSARQNLIQQLQSYGIDPSAGRYAGLEAAENAATGASAAAAGTQSALATKAQGIQALESAVQAGQQLPGAAVNALNTELQGLSGAENAELGAANTGVNLEDAAAPYLSAAMNFKYPPTGQISGSSSSQAQQPPKAPGSGNNSDTGSPWAPQQSPGGSGPLNAAAGSKAQTVSAPGGGSQYSRNAQTQDVPGGTPDTGQEPGAWPAAGSDANNTAALPDSALGNPDFNPWGSPSGNFGIPAPSSDQFNPTAGSPDISSQFGAGIGPNGMPLGAGSPDTSASGSTSGAGGDAEGLPTDMPAPPDESPGYDSSPGAGAGSGDSGDGGYSDSGGGDGGDSGDGSGDYGGGEVYAAGGQIIPQRRPMPPPHMAPMNATTGGHVPRTASPSGGRNIDDVHANLNAGEFVMPKDVTEWKGLEHMHKIIADARMKRHQMVAALGVGGKMKPQTPGPVRFQSSPIQ